MSIRLADPGRRHLLARSSTQIAITVALGLAVAFQAIDPAAELFRTLAAIVVVVVVGAAFLARSPRWAIAGFLLATFTGLNVFTTSFGAVSLRPADAFFVVLVIWALSRRRTRRPSDVGQGVLLLLLATLALSLLPLAADSVGGFLDALVPWGRLVQTLSMVWLLPRVLSEEADRRFAVGAVMAAAAFEVVRALLGAASTGIAANRLQGGLGPNAEGLVAGTLLVLALYAPVPRAREVRFGLAGLAIIALLLSRSVGSIASVGIVVGVVGFGRTGQEPTSRSLRPLRILLLVLGVVAVVGVVRQENLPTSQGFANSTAEQRLILASAGVEVFREHPLLGVGWQRSADASAIGSEKVVTALQQQFKGVRSDFLPQEGAAATASVHNTYIQILAEAGLAGGVVLVLTMSVCATRLRDLRRRLTGVDAQLARSVVAVLGVTLVWLNDNALFGAQPESVLLGVTLGVLASIPAPSDDTETRSPPVAAA